MQLAKGILPLTVALVLSLAPGCGYSPEASALMESRRAVTARLTSPGSAKFDITRVAARSDEERLFVVYVVVDSQNGFGALLRSHALALIKAGETFDDSDQVLHLEITETSPPIARIKQLTQEFGSSWLLEEWVSGP